MVARRYLSLILPPCLAGAILVQLDKDIVRQSFPLKRIKRNARAPHHQARTKTSNNTTRISTVNMETKKRLEDSPPIFFLHVGPMKSGTTTIQISIPSNPALERDNYSYVGLRIPARTRDKFGVRTGLVAFRKSQSMVFLNKLTKRLQRKRSHLIMSSEDFTVTLGSVDKNGVDFCSSLEKKKTTGLECSSSSWV